VTFSRFSFVVLREFFDVNFGQSFFSPLRVVEDRTEVDPSYVSLPKELCAGEDPVFFAWLLKLLHYEASSLCHPHRSSPQWLFHFFHRQVFFLERWIEGMPAGRSLLQRCYILRSRRRDQSEPFPF